MPYSPAHAPLLSWYDASARELPWRSPQASPWAVLVSEVMLQQTPVRRVLPVYAEWLTRWPTPRRLAAAPAGEAVRQWGRLGYPRRALRLHAAAVEICDRHAGEVPAQVDELRGLPGIGEYTAAAVATFGFGQRHAVLDTNVRRVLARAFDGSNSPPGGLTVAERLRAERLLPDEAPTAARWGVAVMELGALVCTARDPRCAVCPLADQCRWRQLGWPAPAGPARRAQRYAGTDRECRGRLLQVLRQSVDPVSAAALAAAWDEPVQRARALDSLVSDGLVEPLPAKHFALPS
jgi:A/G-specific adenine glycosylase